MARGVTTTSRKILPRRYIQLWNQIKNSFSPLLSSAIHIFNKFHSYRLFRCRNTVKICIYDLHLKSNLQTILLCPCLINKFLFLRQVMPFPGARQYYPFQHLYQPIFLTARLPSSPALQRFFQINQKVHCRLQNRYIEKRERTRRSNRQKTATMEIQERRAKMPSWWLQLKNERKKFTLWKTSTKKWARSLSAQKIKPQGH